MENSASSSPALTIVHPSDTGIAEEVEQCGVVHRIPIKLICPYAGQPRKSFDETEFFAHGLTVALIHVFSGGGLRRKRGPKGRS